MQHTKIGSVCDNKVRVSVVTPEAGGRGTPRVELAVYGARYAYRLSPAEARALADSLTAAAENLTSPSAIDQAAWTNL